MHDGFEPVANMVVNKSGLHSVRETVRHASRLVEQGGPEELELAGKMIGAVIECQERRQDGPNFGNYRWYKENEVVEDLNGVSFTLSTLIPMMLRHGDRLPEDLRTRVLESVRLGLKPQSVSSARQAGNIAALDASQIDRNDDEVLRWRRCGRCRRIAMERVWKCWALLPAARSR